MPVESWVGSKMGEGLAHQLAKEEQEQHEREKANQPPGAIPTPGEGGALGPGEEEFGDPMRCYVDEHTATSGDKAAVGGSGGCYQGLPAGTWIYACVGVKSDAGGKTLGKCDHIEVKGHTSRHWSIGESAAVHCAPYEIVVALVEFYVPGGQVLYAGTENGGECAGNSDEADEAGLELFGTSSNLDAVKGVLEFFEAESE